MRNILKSKLALLTSAIILIIIVGGFVMCSSDILNYFDNKKDYEAYEELCLNLNSNNVKEMELNDNNGISDVAMDSYSFNDLSYYNNDDCDTRPADEMYYSYILRVEFRNGNHAVLAVRNSDGVVEITYKERRFLCTSYSMENKIGIFKEENE